LAEFLINVGYAISVRLHLAKLIGPVAAAAGVALVTISLLRHGIDAGLAWGNFVIGLIRAIWGFLAGRIIFQAIRSEHITPPPLPLALLTTALVTALWIDPGPLRGAYDAAFAILLGPALVIIGAASSPGRLAPAALFLGGISYAVYALHWPTLLTLHQYHWAGAPFIGLGYLGVLVGSSWLIDRFIDAPARRWLNRLVSDIQRPSWPASISRKSRADSA
jgi:peptidoglycan/LPS O-acetylase OafA/YrhL